MTERRLSVTRPTFAELAKGLTTAGMQFLTEDGGMVIKDMEIVADGLPPLGGRAARTATSLVDRIFTHDDGAPAYEAEGILMFVRCRPDGIHVVRMSGADRESEIVIPREAIFGVMADVLDCLASHK